MKLQLCENYLEVFLSHFKVSPLLVLHFDQSSSLLYWDIIFWISSVGFISCTSYWLFYITFFTFNVCAEVDKEKKRPVKFFLKAFVELWEYTPNKVTLRSLFPTTSVFSFVTSSLYFQGSLILFHTCLRKKKWKNCFFRKFRQPFLLKRPWFFYFR